MIKTDLFHSLKKFAVLGDFCKVSELIDDNAEEFNCAA